MRKCAHVRLYTAFVYLENLRLLRRLKRQNYNSHLIVTE